MRQENYIDFFNKCTRSIAARVCFLVFFAKMLISISPIFVDTLEKGTVLQVVMQLEIDLTGNGMSNNTEDLHEHGVKVFKPDAFNYLSFNPSVESTGKQRNYLRNEKGICSYHPSVPTPPPNC